METLTLLRQLPVKERAASSRSKDRLILKAQQEILLECGQSSMLLRKDGTIILKGVKIVSRASRSNKVRGAVVKIN